MKIFTDVQQGSVQWLQLHVGVPTASEFRQILTDELEPRTGEMPKTYLAKKLAEKWRNAPLPGFSSHSVEQGTIREEEARPWYELTHGIDVQQVGFVLADDGRCGCSPDGLIGDDSGLEIKCPEAQTHVKYLLNGGLPKEYAPQVYGSLFVTGRKEWRFLSYHRGFPALELTIKRDEAIMDRIGKTLAKFYKDFDAALAALNERNK